MELARHIAHIFTGTRHNSESTHTPEVITAPNNLAPLEATKTPDEVRTEMNKIASILSSES